MNEMPFVTPRQLWLGADPPSDPHASDPPRTPKPVPGTETHDPDVDQPPHDHGDDPGVHPGGPKHYHEDYGSSRRMAPPSSRLSNVNLEQGVSR